MSNPALGIYESVSASGNTDPFPLNADATVYVACNVETITAGTFQGFLEMQDVDGTWQSVAALTAQTSPGKQSAVVQPATVVSNVINVARLRWTYSGGDVTYAGIVIGI